MGADELLHVCPSVWWLNGQEATPSARAAANAIGRDEVDTPADLLGEEDTLPRLQLDVVLGAQLEERPEGLEQLLRSGAVK